MTIADPSAAALRSELRGTQETRQSPRSEFELREVQDGTGATQLRLSMFACVSGDHATYEMEDAFGPWLESVDVSAFDVTLADGADVVFLVQHTGLALARTKPGTLKLSAIKDSSSSPVPGLTGLYSEALLDPGNFYVQALRSAVERGDLSEASFAFRVVRQEWSKDWTRRRILEVSLAKGDVSLCAFGANDRTSGTVSMRQRFDSRGQGGEVGRFLHLTDNIYEARRREAELARHDDFTPLPKYDFSADRARLEDMRRQGDRQRIAWARGKQADG